MTLGAAILSLSQVPRSSNSPPKYDPIQLEYTDPSSLTGPLTGGSFCTSLLWTLSRCGRCIGGEFEDLGRLVSSKSYQPRQRDSSSTYTIKDSRVTRRLWETTCRPTLEDHDSRQPECKRCFLLAYSRHEGLSFTFCF